MVASVVLLEAIGPGPQSETVIASTGELVLLAADAHSTVFAPLLRRDTGLAVYSCERWVRLKFTGNSVRSVRFWIANYDPGPGWSVSYGITDAYRKPTTSASDIAILPVPVDDPGAGQSNIAATADSYTPWVVLQARWDADDSTPMQSTELQYRFAYNED